MWNICILPSSYIELIIIIIIASIYKQTKNEVRNIRKDALDSVKKLKNLVSEDDVRKLTKDVRFVSNYICHVYIYIPLWW